MALLTQQNKGPESISVQLQRRSVGRSDSQCSVREGGWVFFAVLVRDEVVVDGELFADLLRRLALDHVGDAAQEGGDVMWTVVRYSFVDVE